MQLPVERVPIRHKNSMYDEATTTYVVPGMLHSTNLYLNYNKHLIVPTYARGRCNHHVCYEVRTAKPPFARRNCSTLVYSESIEEKSSAAEDGVPAGSSSLM